MTENMSKEQYLLESLQNKSSKINEKVEELTNFYIELDNYLRGLGLGTAVTVKADDSSQPEDESFRFAYEEVEQGDGVSSSTWTELRFWRIGYGKVHGKWHVTALRYKVNPIDGPKPHFELDKRIPLTHAPRRVRVQASHLIPHLVYAIHNQVEDELELAEQANHRLDEIRNRVRIGHPG